MWTRSCTHSACWLAARSHRISPRAKHPSVWRDAKSPGAHAAPAPHLLPHPFPQFVLSPCFHLPHSQQPRNSSALGQVAAVGWCWRNSHVLLAAFKAQCHGSFYILSSIFPVEGAIISLCFQGFSMNDGIYHHTDGSYFPINAWIPVNGKWLVFLFHFSALPSDTPPPTLPETCLTSYTSPFILLPHINTYAILAFFCLSMNQRNFDSSGIVSDRVSSNLVFWTLPLAARSALSMTTRMTSVSASPTPPTS